MAGNGYPTNGRGMTNQPTLFINALLFDGTGADPRPNSALMVEGNRITKIGSTADFGSGGSQGARVIDCGGRFLMPGMVDAHFHISYANIRELPDLDLRCPPEETTIWAVKNAELILRHGFTSGRSAGSLHRVDVAMRDAINRGLIPGPRLLASGRDICPTSGMLDWNPSYWKLGMEGLAIFADGVEECRKAARMMIKENVDIIKVYVTGEGILRPNMPPEDIMMTFEEVKVVCDEAHMRHRRVCAHCRATEAAWMCAKAGVDMVEHATVGELTPEMIETFVEKNCFIIPSLGYAWAICHKGHEWGITPEVLEFTKYPQEYEQGSRNADILHRAGVRVLPFGDYGFVWNPHGEQARDLELFVKDMGFTPKEVLVAATKWGGEIMTMEDQIGTLEEGKLADLLVVNGNPLEDITILQPQESFALVMKDGHVMTNQFGLPQVLSAGEAPPAQPIYALADAAAAIPH